MDKNSVNLEKAAAAVARHFTAREPAAPAAKKLLDVGEAAAALGLGRSVTYRLLMSGELVSLRIGGRRLVPVGEIDAFIERQLAAQ